mmetsp:Transcript_11995/g.28301  ORF Transcript_11995/g.28301 Transcript_11995/m.28301 type:complete len:254 (+) Transcript_11995:232-993(+)
MPSTSRRRRRRSTAIPPCPSSTSHVPAAAGGPRSLRTARPEVARPLPWAASRPWWRKICTSCWMRRPRAILPVLRTLHLPAASTIRPCTSHSSKSTAAGFRICSTSGSASRFWRMARARCRSPASRSSRRSMPSSSCPSSMPATKSAPPMPPRPMTRRPGRMPFVRCCCATRRPDGCVESFRWSILPEASEAPTPRVTTGSAGPKARRLTPASWPSRSASAPSTGSWATSRTVPRSSPSSSRIASRAAWPGRR